MPWEGGKIYVAAIDTGGTGVSLRNTCHISGKENEVSAGFPEWASKGTIFFTSDISRYQNPWKYTLGARSAQPVLTDPIAEDFSEPPNKLGGSFGAKVDVNGEGTLFFALRDGRTVLYFANLEIGVINEVECPYVKISHLRHIGPGRAVFIAGKSTEPEGVVLMTIEDHSKVHSRV